MPTPLQIALQEYAYWRDCEAAGDADPNFEALLIGALGAAANITARISGASPEGIIYKALTPDQITSTLMEIKLAPRLARVLSDLHEAVRGLRIIPDGYTGKDIDRLFLVLDESGPLLAELKKAGAL